MGTAEAWVMRAIGSVALVFGILAIFAPTSQGAMRSEKNPKRRTEKSEPFRVGHIELKGAYPEGAEPTSLFGNATETLSEIVGRLDKAGDDAKLGAVILRINDPTLGWAKVNELTHAIARLRHKGKRVIAYLDSATTHDYLVAAACDQIVMPESGEVVIVGLRAEVTFFKNLFDWLHLKADMLRVGEYKSAAEPYLRTEMSKEFRHEMEEILDDYLKQIVDGISKSRKLDRAKVLSAIDGGPYTARRAGAGPRRQDRLRGRDRGVPQGTRAQAGGPHHQELRQEKSRQRLQRLFRHDEDDEPADGGRAAKALKLQPENRSRTRRRGHHVGKEREQLFRQRVARLRDVH